MFLKKMILVHKIISSRYTIFFSFSNKLAAFGGYTILFGFLALLGGSQGHVTSTGDIQVIALTVINTILSAAAGGLTAFFIRRTWGACYGHHSSVLTMINGALTGAVRFHQ